MNALKSDKLTGKLVMVEIYQVDGKEPKIEVYVTPEMGRRCIYYGQMEGAKEAVSTLMDEAGKVLEWFDAHTGDHRKME